MKKNDRCGEVNPVVGCPGNKQGRKIGKKIAGMGGKRGLMERVRKEVCLEKSGDGSKKIVTARKEVMGEKEDKQ